MGIEAYRANAADMLPRELWPSAAYAAIVTYIGQAQRAFGRGEGAAARNMVERAEHVVRILTLSLTNDGSGLHERLRSLYEYMSAELAGAAARQDTVRLAALAEMVVPLRDAWEEAGRRVLRGDAPAPVVAMAAAAPAGRG